MKKSCLLLLLCTAFLISCEDQSEIVPSSDELSVAQDVDMTDFYLYTDQSDDTGKVANGKGIVEKCFSMKVLNQQLDANPGLYQKMYNVEKHTRQFIAGKKPDRPGGGNGNGGGNGGGGGEEPTPYEGTVNIPVYVHVIYNNSSENISQSQIQSQIDVLNADFSASNGDFSSIPSDFSGVAGNANVQFTLAGTTIKQSNRTSWPTDNSMKYSSNGGQDAISPSTHLNIWVVNYLTSGSNTILGYAQFPGGSQTTDGVVIGHKYFGTNGTATQPFDQGRTGTHEVGHYLNLRHIWGDGRCKQDDFVGDTPSSDRPNYYCPGPNEVISHCRSRDMHMNYMDYVDDSCMYMFTNGQVDRMRALFASGGIREDLIN
ncbi:zinc metalloprotease [Urechidicola vernalis]|uniref:Zinc metalloprotease n=1 Tax=Urechidicola vernalis TaxID=3075600 RepID=A0ABU2Y697_9FLAO|nr:zinc metalloprotease [Urechidicola sp. P050]MDT0553331.1 zinc metalloprotease [Urechidicola sp. P050]